MSRQCLCGHTPQLHVDVIGDADAELAHCRAEGCDCPGFDDGEDSRDDDDEHDLDDLCEDEEDDEVMW